VFFGELCATNVQKHSRGRLCHMRVGYRRRGLLYPIKPKPGLIGAQPAVHNSFFNPALTPGFDVLGPRPSADPWVYWVTLGEIGWKAGAGDGRAIAKIANIAKDWQLNKRASARTALMKKLIKYEVSRRSRNYERKRNEWRRNWRKPSSHGN
jgi:hypothetical protein